MPESQAHLVNVSDFEFELPCSPRECDAPAEWAVWTTFSHSDLSFRVPPREDHQEATLHYCTRHKEMVERLLAQVLRLAHPACWCGEPIIGQMSDNLRAVAL